MDTVQEFFSHSRYKLPSLLYSSVSVFFLTGVLKTSVFQKVLHVQEKCLFFSSFSKINVLNSFVLEQPQCSTVVQYSSAVQQYKSVIHNCFLSLELLTQNKVCICTYIVNCLSIISFFFRLNFSDHITRSGTEVKRRGAAWFKKASKLKDLSCVRQLGEKTKLIQH